MDKRKVGVTGGAVTLVPSPVDTVCICVTQTTDISVTNHKTLLDSHTIEKVTFPMKLVQDYSLEKHCTEGYVAWPVQQPDCEM